MNPLNLELAPVLRLDRPLKLTLWNPVKNLPDFHLDLLLLQPIISQKKSGFSFGSATPAKIDSDDSKPSVEKSE